MKFDVIVGNPPYQMPNENNNCGNTNGLWPKFIEKSIEICKPNGYISLVHPSAWRGNGKFSKIGELLKSKKIDYMEIHDIKDGEKTFKATTRYDWYVLQNALNDDSFMTTIKDEQGNMVKINIKNMDFIPNFDIDAVVKLIAKPNEQKANLIASQSMYQVCKPHMSDKKDIQHKFPCVKYVSTKGKIDIRWSNANNGHFGIKKVIFGTGAGVGGIYIDEKGEYGMCNFVAGIASDSLEELKNIKKALESEKFKTVMKACQFTTQMYNKNVISLFRHDFWKEFI
jgi:hypothetical protein